MEQRFGAALRWRDADGREPPHIHVREGSSLAKFWLSPVELASSSGLAHSLWAIERIVREQRVRFLEAWNDFFASRTQRARAGGFRHG